MVSVILGKRDLLLIRQALACYLDNEKNLQVPQISKEADDLFKKIGVMLAVDYAKINVSYDI